MSRVGRLGLLKVAEDKVEAILALRIQPCNKDKQTLAEVQAAHYTQTVPARLLGILEGLAS
jgi:hypothetical protein